MTRLLFFFTFFFFLGLSCPSYSAPRVNVYPPSETWMIEGVPVNANAAAEITKSLINRAFTPSGSPIDLPVTLKSVTPRAALVARAALTLFGAAGAALTAYSIYDLLTQGGSLIGSDGTIMGSEPSGCFVSLSSTVLNSCGYQQTVPYCDPLAAMIALCTFEPTRQTLNSTYVYTSGPYLGKENRSYTVYRTNPNGTETGYSASALVPVGYSGPVSAPATQSEFESEIEAHIPDNAALYNAVKADASKSSELPSFPGAVITMSRGSVSATPVRTEYQDVSTSTYPMPDGSTVTEDVSEAYAYYPTLSGIDATTGELVSTPIEQDPFTGEFSPVELDNIVPGSEQIGYESYSQQQIDTINNTTGETTTTTTQTNHGNNSTTVVETNTTTELDICQSNPGILACETLGDLIPSDPVEIETQTVGEFTTPESVAGSCPAPIVSTLSSGQTIEYSYATVCQYGTAMRPFVIVSALIAAGFLLSGSVRVGI